MRKKINPEETVSISFEFILTIQPRDAGRQIQHDHRSTKSRFSFTVSVKQRVMKADHMFYKAHGIYDFPQKQKKRILQMKLVGAILTVSLLSRKR